MKKWLGLFLLLGVVAVVGCSKGPSQSQRQVKDAGEAKVDAAQEKAALNPSAAKPLVPKK